jgi:hypothetical protein
MDFETQTAAGAIAYWKCLGSGDPPGLQNRRSFLTDDGVFDSHALPPPVSHPLDK